MNLFRMALLTWLCLGLAAMTAAQDLPAPPPNGLRDDTRALTEKVRAELVRDIASCRTALNVDVWFTAGTFLTSSQNIRSQARELRQHWSPGKDAVLLTYDRASDALAFSFSPGLWQRYPAAEIIGIMQRGGVVMADRRETLEARLSKTLRDLIQKLKSLEKQHLQSEITLSRHHLHLAQIFALSLSGGALLLGMIGIVARRQDVQAAWQSFFPQVQIGTRFGALHGGGVIVERQTLGH